MGSWVGAWHKCPTLCDCLLPKWKKVVRMHFGWLQTSPNHLPPTHWLGWVQAVTAIGNRVVNVNMLVSVSVCLSIYLAIYVCVRGHSFARSLACLLACLLVCLLVRVVTPPNLFVFDVSLQRCVGAPQPYTHATRLYCTRCPRTGSKACVVAMSHTSTGTRLAHRQTDTNSNQTLPNGSMVPNAMCPTPCFMVLEMC